MFVGMKLFCLFNIQMYIKCILLFVHEKHAVGEMNWRAPAVNKQESRIGLLRKVAFSHTTSVHTLVNLLVNFEIYT